jgi:hypothetical protein
MEEDASRNMIAEMVPRMVTTGSVPENVGVDATADAAPEAGENADSTAEISSTTPENAGRNAQSLKIEPDERNFMLQLAGAVGKSPRRLKRFVNTYRILKASLDALQHQTFVLKGGSEGDYRAAMVLLAITTGAPRSSLGMLDFLASCPETGDLVQFEDHIKQSPDPAEAKYAQAALNAYRTVQPNTTVTLKTLREWAAQVARFSFRSGRL